MRKTIGIAGVALLASCGGPGKPVTPALTPQLAAELLHYNNNAQNWLIHVKRQNASCEYQLDLPEQLSHPTQIDLDHIVRCGGAAAPREFDARVSFEYNPETKQWAIKRFAS